MLMWLGGCSDADSKKKQARGQRINHKPSFSLFPPKHSCKKVNNFLPTNTTTTMSSALAQLTVTNRLFPRIQPASN